MPFIPDQNHHRAGYSTHVWLDDDDEEGVNSSYSSEAEARVAFEKLEAGGGYKYGGLYRWNPGQDEWVCIDAWPDEFDGFEWS
jgi:hypothetical protein